MYVCMYVRMYVCMYVNLKILTLINIDLRLGILTWRLTLPSCQRVRWSSVQKEGSLSKCDTTVRGRHGNRCLMTLVTL